MGSPDPQKASEEDTASTRDDSDFIDGPLVDYKDIRSTGKRKQMGQEMEIESIPGNYKSVSGVMMPFSIEQKNAGKPLIQITIEKYEVNVPAEDTQFHFPEKPKDKPPADKN
jgi:hypothetical protein